MHFLVLQAGECHVLSHQASIMKSRCKRKDWIKNEINTATQRQQQTCYLKSNLRERSFYQRTKLSLKQNIIFCLFTQKTVSRFVLNHSDPSGTCRDHSCFNVTYSKKKAEGWEHLTDRQKHQSFSISPWKNQLLPMLGNGWGTLQMRFLLWQPSFTAVTCMAMINHFVLRRGIEMHVWCLIAT